MRWIPSPEPIPRRESPTSRALLVLAGISLVHIVLAWLSRIPALSWGEDDAAYIQLARQLRHFSYREIQDIAAPIHARFPPGYPLIIAVLTWPFGDRVDALLALNTLFTVGTIVLLYLTARRHLGETLALIVSALFAVNPMSVWDSGHVMAEAPFKFLMMLGLWALTREEEDARFSVLAGGAMIAAALTRSAGIFFLPALFIYWILRRRYKHAAVLTVASLLTVGAWMGWTFMAPDPENRRLYVADLGHAGPRRGRLEFIFEMSRRIPQRAYRLATIVLPFVISLPVIRGTVIDNVLWLGATVLFGAIGFVLLFRRWTMAAFITTFYGGLLLIWRYAVERFANPLVPFLYTELLVGADWLAARFVPRIRTLVMPGLAALFVVGAMQLNTARLRDQLRCDRADPVASTGCWDAQYRAYLQAARWVRDSTPNDATFFVNKERGFFMHTGRRSVNQDRVLQEDSVSVAPFLTSRGVRYTVVGPVGTRSQAHGLLVAQACRDFVLMKSFPERTLVLRVREAGDAPDDAACVALEPYRRQKPPSPE